MQWWSSAEIQSDFCNEMVALLGPSGKQNTANIEALEGMSWSKDELDNLKAQFNAVTCTPEYPGGYSDWVERRAAGMRTLRSSTSITTATSRLKSCCPMWTTSTAS